MALTVTFRNSANVPKNSKISGGDNTDREFDIQMAVHHDIFLQ